MRYHGGKTRIAKDISNIIISMKNESNIIVSLFCGSCAIEEKLVDVFDKVICNDNNKYLIDMFKDLQNGRDFPENVSEEMWRWCKDNKDIDTGLTGYIGFGGSFGGRFFQGYARGENRNFIRELKNSLNKQIKNIKK